jgi:hypothetical protein
MQDDKLETYHILPRIQIASAFGLLLVFCYSLQYFKTPSAFVLVLGAGLIGSGASYVAGFLMGLIFGIPRTPPRAPTPAPAPVPAQGTPASAATPTSSPEHDIEPNSNLVEISDWLTKVLVGVGLVELGKIPGKLDHLAQYLAMGLRRCPPNTADQPAADLACLQSSHALAMGIIVFFTISGFLFGYLWSRLYLQRALGQLNRVKQEVGEVKASVFVALSRVFTGLGTWQDPQPNQIGASYYQKALDYLNKGLAKYPADPQLHLEIAIVLKSYAMSQQPRDVKMIEGALAHMVEYVKLVPDDPVGFYNLACYQALTGKDVKLIAENLDQAFKFKPGLMAAAWTDDDLISVRNSPEFKAVAGPPPSPQNQGTSQDH